MKLGLLPLAAATGSLIVAAVLVAVTVGASGSGGGGDTSTLQGYFQTLNSVQTEISDQYSAISVQFPEAFSDKQQTLDYLDASAAAWSDGMDRLQSIDPPEAAVPAHQALVEATGDVSDAFAAIRVSAEDIEDNETALGALVDSADTSPFDDFGTACSTLQTLADDNGITDETGAAIILVC